MKRTWVIVLLCVMTLSGQRAFAAADEYDDSQSNPFRVVAYLAYPVGWLAEWLVFRPFHYLVSATPAEESFFGHRPHPPILAEPQPIQDYGVPKGTPLRPTEPQAAISAPVITPERVTVAEVPVEKLVIKEVPKIVETEKIVFPAVAFRFDAADLTDLGKGQVYLAAQRLKEKNDITVVIEGHADAVGSDEYNQKLAQRRAQTVMRELSSLGVEPDRMSAVSLGESRPLIAQETDWARAVNRRVEFQVKGSR